MNKKVLSLAVAAVLTVSASVGVSASSCLKGAVSRSENGGLNGSDSRSSGSAQAINRRNSP